MSEAATIDRPTLAAAEVEDPTVRQARAIAALDPVGLIAHAGAQDDAAAIRSMKLWLGLRPGEPNAFVVWFNLGVALGRTGDRAQAATAYANALSLKPDLSEASVNLALARESLGEREAAYGALRRALPAAGARRLLHLHLGRMLEDDGRLAEAAEELRASLLVDPDQPDVQQHLVHIRQRICAWPPTDLRVPGLAPATAAGNCGPLGALALHDDPAAVTAVNAAWIARKYPPAPERLAPPEGYAHDRLRIGYLSSDFCRHALSFLMAEVIERHDRAAFEIYGYCASPEDGSAVQARVRAGFDHHVPVRELSDAALARRIRADEIDVLVDLNGLTKGSRIAALRWRPAPVQATYLGYVGPVPLPELDWMICDAVTVPDAEVAGYAPAPLRLPGCYQANDAAPFAAPPVSRAEEGLPEDAFVFCCFSHHYKLTEETFAAWTHILRQSPGSVLWIVDDGPDSRKALQAGWAAAGLGAERLIFAQRVDPDRYRARMALGDLYLDTTPYNAGTIASDALRMGLPILTRRGRSFSGRMAASLLTAIGRPELIAASMEDYVARAVALATDRPRHAALKAGLDERLWRSTLGDSARFTRTLEDAYRSIRPGGSRHTGVVGTDAPHQGLSE